MEEPIIDRAVLRRLHAELGPAVGRLLAWFRDDGIKSVAAIEAAVRGTSAAPLVLPAHTLKGEALQFGATPLAALAEHIEFTARTLVETQAAPAALALDAARLRSLFECTLAALDRDLAPATTPAATRPVFGRKAFGTAVR